MVMSRALAAAKAINSPVRNCEDNDPSTVMLAGTRGPFIVKGNKPLFVLTSTWSLGKTSLKNDTGLFNKLPVPVIEIAVSLMAAMDVNIRTDNPLSPQLILSDTGFTPLLSIIIVSPDLSTVAPNCLIISSAA